MRTVVEYLTPLLIGATIGLMLIGQPAWAAALTCAAVFSNWIFTVSVKDDTKKIITIALIASLASIHITPSKAEPPPGQDLIAQACAGIIVVVVGGVIVIGLNKMCKRLNPPATPPQKPGQTNAPPSHTLAPASSPRFNFNDTAMIACDISMYSATNADFNGPDGLPYQEQFTYRFRYSTNGTTWTTNSIEGYTSPTLLHATCNGQTVICNRQSFPRFDIGEPADVMMFQPVP